MWIPLPPFPGMTAVDTVFSISNNNKGIYPNFPSYVIFFFFYMTKLWEVWKQVVKLLQTPGK